MTISVGELLATLLLREICYEDRMAGETETASETTQMDESPKMMKLQCGCSILVDEEAAGNVVP